VLVCYHYIFFSLNIKCFFQVFQNYFLRLQFFVFISVTQHHCMKWSIQFIMWGHIQKNQEAMLQYITPFLYSLTRIWNQSTFLLVHCPSWIMDPTTWWVTQKNIRYWAQLKSNTGYLVIKKSKVTKVHNYQIITPPSVIKYLYVFQGHIISLLQVTSPFLRKPTVSYTMYYWLQFAVFTRPCIRCTGKYLCKRRRCIAFSLALILSS
jgi:hypothetical protein